MQAKRALGEHSSAKSCNAAHYNKGNLRLARKELEKIKQKIANRTFDIHEAFPNYRRRRRNNYDQLHSSAAPTCNKVFDNFLTHCQVRVDLRDLAYSTMTGYRRLLDSIWRPNIGTLPMDEVRYTRLVTIAETHAKNKRTYNNIVSVARCALGFTFKDYPDKYNPAKDLKTLRITKKDRPPIDPFTIQEGEQIIARSHREFGPTHGNYEELRFFTGIRQSEVMALQVSDVDLEKGTVKISKAYVRGRLEDRTKTKEDREIRLCKRARQVLRRQLAVWETMSGAGKIRHAFVFFEADGSAPTQLELYVRSLAICADRAWHSISSSQKRATFLGLMVFDGKQKPAPLAAEDGHSVETMFRTYAAWAKDATEADIRTIKRAMKRSPKPHYPIALANVLAPTKPPILSHSTSGAQAWGRLSWRKYQRTHPLH